MCSAQRSEPPSRFAAILALNFDTLPGASGCTASAIWTSCRSTQLQNEPGKYSCAARIAYRQLGMQEFTI
jgi:hypothetical protein